MEILISNDDGIYADGINVLAQNLASIANIMVVAPDRNRSGASNSLTLDAPLRTKNLGKDRISVEGTPTDCVHLAVTGLFKDLPDMVVAGINEGANLGDDILYSGTVAAATEGRFLGLPAMAISLVCDGDVTYHYDTAARVAERLVKRIIKDPLPVDTILNINVPNVPLADIQGYEVTRLGTRHCAEPIIERLDPRGRKVYWVGPSGAEEDAGAGTDFHAIRARKVSITPLKIDLTHYQAFEQLASWVGHFND